MKKAITLAALAIVAMSCTNSLRESTATNLDVLPNRGELYACLEYTVEANPSMTGINACTGVYSYVYVDTSSIALFQGRHDAAHVYRTTDIVCGSPAGLAAPADGIHYYIESIDFDGDQLAVNTTDTLRLFARIRRDFALSEVADKYLEMTFSPSSTTWNTVR